MDQQTDQITDKAAELGKLIAGSSSGKALLSARQELQDDKEAHAILESYQKQLQKIAELEEGGKPTEPEDKRALAQLQQDVASHSTLKSWMKAQADFSQLMHKVNRAIAEPFGDASSDSTPESA